MERKEASSAATDVQEFITDLDGGQFDRMLSVALSQSAAAAVDPMPGGLTMSGPVAENIVTALSDEIVAALQDLQGYHE